jgi:glycosyltransferase involved in cell wall biosynthesis
VDCSHFRPPSQDERKQARSALAIPDEAFVVGFAGRLTPDKGIEDLFSAMKLVLAKNGSAILAIAGSPDQSSPLTEQTLSQLNEPWVAHLGAVGDMLKFYWALDAFCLPSHREGLPNVNLEAAATALPVVTTDVTGCRDSVVDQKTGWLVAAGNPFDIADRILELSRKPHLASQFGLEGREWVSCKYDRVTVWSNYLELLRRTPALPLFPERT